MLLARFMKPIANIYRKSKGFNRECVDVFFGILDHEFE